MATTTVVIAAAAVVSAGISIYSSEASQASSTAARREARAVSAQNIAYSREEQARLEKEEEESRIREEERLAPWYAAQKSALEKYTEMAENPEISDLTRIRLEEEEKAINKELAAKGLLFSGPAAELRQKARERIIAEETESAKGMLQNVMSAQAPASGIYPGTAQYNSLIASLTPRATTTGASGTAGQGALGVGSAILGGAQSYLTYQGSKDIADGIAKQRTQGLYGYPLSIYGQPGYGGSQGVGLMSSPETGLPIY